MIYLDASAAIKTLILEPESESVRELFASGTEFVSSRLLEVELNAVADRRRLSALAVRVLVERVAIVSLDDTVAIKAIDLRSGLRTVDALHLATALVIRETVTEFLSFDGELNAAVEAHGIACHPLSG